MNSKRKGKVKVKSDKAPAPSAKVCDSSNQESRLARYRTLAHENLQREKLDAAQRCLEKAVYLAVRRYGTNHLEVGVNLKELGAVLRQRGMIEAAEALVGRAQRIMQFAGG